jgi:hypothetical protein
MSGENAAVHLSSCGLEDDDLLSGSNLATGRLLPLLLPLRPVEAAGIIRLRDACTVLCVQTRLLEAWTQCNVESYSAKRRLTSLGTVVCMRWQACKLVACVAPVVGHGS